jgi:hypothetical protein
VEEIMKGSVRLVLFVVAVLVASANFLHADSLGLATNSDGNHFMNEGTFTLGYSFQVNTAISVTALAVYDAGSDGLNVSHEVGIWDATGNLLASTSVAAGTVAPIRGDYRYATIPDLPLTAGNIYYVGSVNGMDNDPFMLDPSSFLPAPGITYLSRRFENSGGGLVFPDLAGGGGNTGFFGGNFLFVDSAATPEPSTLLMFSSGVMGLAGLLRRKIIL